MSGTAVMDNTTFMILAAMLLVLVIAIGYLIGSFPTGVILARLMGLGDLRQIGSGNIGATNVLRTGNKRAALGTLIGDAGKGALAVLLVRWFWGDPLAMIAGLAAFVGHCWPVWLGFRGGKGVATFLGVMLALNWPVGLACCATWALVAWRMRISSLAALVASGLSPVFVLFSAMPNQALVAALMTVLLWWRHVDNMRRIDARTEPRIGA